MGNLSRRTPDGVGGGEGRTVCCPLWLDPSSFNQDPSPTRVSVGEGENSQLWCCNAQASYEHNVSGIDFPSFAARECGDPLKLFYKRNQDLKAKEI